MQRGELGERKTMEPYRVGNHIHAERTERQRKRRVQHAEMKEENSWREREK